MNYDRRPRPRRVHRVSVRHGSTENNVARPPRLQGRRVDLGLSAQGRREAERTAQLLANQPLAAIYSSPLQRARETALCIANPHGLPVTLVEELVEADVGDWEGRSWEEIEASDPESHQRFLTDPATFGYRGERISAQVQRRVGPAMQQLMGANLGGRIVVVGHNVVNRVYLAALLDLPLAKARSIHQDNCGVNVVGYRGGKLQLLTCNAAFHLE